MDDLKSKVLNWLKTQGYPWEMKVASVFRKWGIPALQSTYFKDIETGKQREIDVEATLTYELGQATFAAHFVVECKSTKDKPWIVLQSEENPLDNKGLFMNRSASGCAKATLVKIAESNLTPDEIRPFQVSSNVGYGLIQAKFGEKPEARENNQDRAYAALSSVIACSDSRIAMVDHGEPVLLVVFPVIALDGPLFACTLKDSGELGLDEINRADVISQQSDRSFSNIVSVVREAALDEFVRETRDTMQKFVEHFRPALKSGAEELVKTIQREQLLRAVKEAEGKTITY